MCLQVTVECARHSAVTFPCSGKQEMIPLKPPVGSESPPTQTKLFTAGCFVGVGREFAWCKGKRTRDS